jgi:hypothetical protein
LIAFRYFKPSLSIFCGAKAKLAALFHAVKNNVCLKFAINNVVVLILTLLSLIHFGTLFLPTESCAPRKQVGS